MLDKLDTRYLLGSRIPVLPKFKSPANRWEWPLNSSLDSIAFVINSKAQRTPLSVGMNSDYNKELVNPLKKQ